MPCKTCEYIEFCKKYNKKYKKNEDIETRLYAKIAKYSWRKGQRKTKGEEISQIVSRAYVLKYCPTCGKKI